jgi:hypothetical protein
MSGNGMSWIDRCQPREAEDPPPPLSGPPGRLEQLRPERVALLASVHLRVRSSRQERIRRRIADLTNQILMEERHG